MDVAIYIGGKRLELFDDERIDIMNNVKSIADITKVFADFTQSFTVPASDVNNPIFEYWHDEDVDGGINWNLRQDAYIEIGTLSYRYGCVELDKNSVKFKNNKPYSYSITFYSNVVNLSDLWGDAELSSLDLSAFNHDYNVATVTDAMYKPTIGSGDIYYPLISALNKISIGGASIERNLIDTDNTISYREFKPAIRDLKIIEAIEAKYGITFSRDFFGRAPFYNKFTWLHRSAGIIKAYGSLVNVDITSAGSLGSGITVDTVDNTIAYRAYVSLGLLGVRTKRAFIKVTPQAGYEDIDYKLIIFNNSNKVVETECKGVVTVPYEGGSFTVDNVLKFYVSSSGGFSFHTRIFVNEHNVAVPLLEYTDTPVQSSTGQVIVSDHIPVMKIKEYINSLIAQFNLIIRPRSIDTFYIDTLDNYYNTGKAYDITPFVNIEEVSKGRPDVKKTINFIYQKAGTILGLRYFKSFQVGYGDLKATYDVSGTDLTVTSNFENMLFERLQNEDTGELTNIQAGYAIDENLEPYCGRPVSFYRNAFTDIDTPIIIQPAISLSRIYHTATEDNLQRVQVTSSLNFGNDNSSYFYDPINESQYFNWWKNYIDEIFNRKTRTLSIKARLPFSIIYRLQLNDRLIIKDKKYKQSDIKIGLTDGQSELNLFTDLGAPLDSENVIDPITIDSTLYTIDSELLTIDMVSIHRPNISYTVNGISRDQYISTACEENFEIKVSSKTNWTLSVIDTGDGTGWLTTDKSGGLRSQYVKVKTAYNTTGGSLRSAIVRFSLDGDSFDLTVNQLP